MSVRVTHSELEKARIRWYEFWNLKSKAYQPFWKWLGELPSNIPMDSKGCTVSEESARKIRLLCSDHYKTFLAAYKAQNYIE